MIKTASAWDKLKRARFTKWISEGVNFAMPQDRLATKDLSYFVSTIKDLRHDNLPFRAFNISHCNAGRGSLNAELSNNEAWVCGRDRRFTFPGQPYTILWAFICWPSIWDYLAAPINLSITRERDIASRNAMTRFNLIREDDLFIEFIKEDDFFLTTGYSTAVLCAISHNCRVEAWNRPQFVRSIQSFFTLMQ
ncbi:hypothetical protein GJ496_007816 [Pomphorhynchus laevis]|nr:hypothetical protein GJ496_007816 [Pomphorhynchus laevis]